GSTLTGFATVSGSAGLSASSPSDAAGGGGAIDWPVPRGRGRGRGGPLAGRTPLAGLPDGRLAGAEVGADAGPAPVAECGGSARLAGAGAAAAGASVGLGAGGGPGLGVGPSGTSLRGVDERWRKPSGKGMTDSRGRGRRSGVPAAAPSSVGSGARPPGGRPGFFAGGDSVLDSPSVVDEE